MVVGGSRGRRALRTHVPKGLSALASYLRFPFLPAFDDRVGGEDTGSMELFHNSVACGFIPFGFIEEDRASFQVPGNYAQLAGRSRMTEVV